MAKREIVKIGDDTLRKKCREVTAFDAKLHLLLDDMAETMYAADGVGLAAPQIGILRRIVVIDVGDGLIEMINPVIVSASGSQVGVEGCLSVPGKHGTVDRPMKVKAKYFDRNGEERTISGKELLARAICHELDHLDGTLYIDKAIDEGEDE